MLLYKPRKQTLTKFWETAHAKFPSSPLKFCWCDKKSTHFGFKALTLRFVVLSLICFLLSEVLKILEHRSHSHAYLQFSFSWGPELLNAWRKNERWKNARFSISLSVSSQPTTTKKVSLLLDYLEQLLFQHMVMWLRRGKLFATW